MTLYYLTRSFYSFQKSGGALLRYGQVNYLVQYGWDVKVILPNYKNNKFYVNNDIILIPFKNKYTPRIFSLLERIGIYEDYLDKWLEIAFLFLKEKIKEEDILFATSGGELGMIKLASLLKREIGCKFVINFHDPLDYSVVNGLRKDKKFHITRETQEKKYLINADLIITSSKVNQLSLQKKYPTLKDNIVNNYFGFTEKIDTKLYKKISSSKLRIAYAGNMGKLQSPEILYEIYKKANNKEIEIYFIGDVKQNRILKKISDNRLKLINFLPHRKFLQFMIENIDVGFVSLTNDYLGACVPSKIYEYINLELPMLGALPNGDGKDIINNNGYGIACQYNDFDNLVKALEKLTDKEFFKKIKENIIKDKNKWFMKNRIKEVDKYLRNLL